MDERVQRYFQNELDAAERLKLLKEITSNEVLKKQFIELQNLYALVALSSHAYNENEGKEAYSHFIQKRKRKAIKHFIVSSVKYAAIIVIVVLSTYWITSQFLLVPASLMVDTNTLYVPAGQRAQLTLQDGTVVWLNAQSTLTYPSHFIGDERRVSIVGEGYFNVAKNKEKPFIVSTADMDMKVLGTEFNVYHYPKTGFVQASLIEGSLQIISMNDPSSKVILKPNEEVVLKNNYLTVSSIKSSDHFLWKDGIYSFENERLEDIMKKLELYYDVKIVIANDALRNIRYTCKFRQRDGIDEIIRIIGKFHYINIKKDKERNMITLS